MVNKFYREIIEKLNSAGVEYPDFEADVLCETVFGRSFKLDMLMERLNPSDEDISTLLSLAERRISLAESVLEVLSLVHSKYW